MKKNSILTLIVAAVISAAPSLHAQSVDSVPVPTASVWSDNAGSQIAHLLTSSSTAVQKKGLNLALGLSGRSDVDLSAASQPLLAIYQSSGDVSFRLAALSVLATIGDEEVMQAVRRNVAQQDSDRVRVAALGALANYYGTQTFSQDADVAEMASGLRANLAYAAR